MKPAASEGLAGALSHAGLDFPAPSGDDTPSDYSELPAEAVPDAVTLIGSLVDARGGAVGLPTVGIGQVSMAGGHQEPFTTRGAVALWPGLLREAYACVADTMVPVGRFLRTCRQFDIEG
ncbi:MAG: hypothetical protein OXG17_04885 [Chloroflexi bacterium]|nr:hypothetical protein [Chloroflexota bacterium]